MADRSAPMDGDRIDIYRTEVRQGVAVAWVNSYSAVVVKTPGATLLFDPVSVAVPQGVSLDLIAISHGHSDHWDPQLVAGLRQRPGLIVAAPPFLAHRMDGSLPREEESVFGLTGPGADPGQAPLVLPMQGAVGRDSGFGQHEGQGAAGKVKPVQPGDELRIGDATIVALRCDHAAQEPMAFLVKTDDGVTVYLPGDTTPFPEMRHLPDNPNPDSLSPGEGDGRQAGASVDVLVWMGTVLDDGARIAELVQPKVHLTYAIAPPAAGVRARDMLASLTPDIPLHALERHQVFVYPPRS